MAHLSSKHVFLAAAAVVLCMSMPSCKAQDAVQIVARAALCFDNHTVINNCLKQMGISTNASAGTVHGGGNAPVLGSSGSLDKLLPTAPNASAVLCNTPCFGHMMLMTDCMDGILSNFQGYSSGLMQGVRAIFQMSCPAAGNNASTTAAAGDASGDRPHAAAHGDVDRNGAASGKMARNVSGGETAAAVPNAANGAAGGGGLDVVGNLLILWVDGHPRRGRRTVRDDALAS